MSRYIDTKWLEDNAKEYSLGYYEEDEWATPLNILDSAPTIEIIRCRECKYWVSDGGALMLCDIHKDPTVPEHFCSYGSRSEKPNNSTTEDCSDVGKE